MFEYEGWPAPYHSESCVCDRCLALDRTEGSFGFWVADYTPAQATAALEVEIRYLRQDRERYEERLTNV